MIIHLVPDDKFVDGFISNQEKFFPQQENHYLTFTKEIKVIKSSKIVTISKDISFTELKNKYPRIQKIIIHGDFSPYSKIILACPKTINITWVFYGFEIFDRMENASCFLGKKSNRIFREYRGINYKTDVKLFFERLRNKLPVNYGATPFKKILDRIDYMAHWVEKDYHFVRKRYNLKHLRFLDFRLSIYFPEVTLQDVKRENLLIGNSANITNNHIEVFDFLSEDFLNNFSKIIIPFSYSGREEYKEKVKEAANKRFGNRVVFLEEFLEKTEYFNLISSVKLAIMGHYRSQGGGNIRFFFENKIDVALFERNNIYKLYKGMGVELHSLDEIKFNEFSFFDKTILEQNQKIFLKSMSEKEVKRKYQDLLINVK